MTGRSRCFTSLLIPILLTLAIPVAAATVATTGLVSNGEGTIGHGSIEPEPVPFDAANTAVQLGSHPQGGLLVGIYTLLAGRDIFNTTTGGEAPLTAHVAPFTGHGTAGVDLNALGVSGTVYYSFRGLALNYLDGNDYNYDLATDIETRLYRGGEFEFYYDAGAGPVVFARSTDVVSAISINWNTLAITQAVVSSTPDTSPGMLAIMTGSTGVSTNPVQTTGSTSEGAPFSGIYGVFNDDGSTWSFDANAVVPVPGLGGRELVVLTAMLLGMGHFLMRARRLGSLDIEPTS
jgi:hypothetical protein